MEVYELGLIKQPVEYDTTKTKGITKSTTDPERGLVNRPGKSTGFYYLDHQTCDSDNGIITDVFATSENVIDTIPHVERIEYQRDKLGFKTEVVCADGAYNSSEI